MISFTDQVFQLSQIRFFLLLLIGFVLSPELTAGNPGLLAGPVCGSVTENSVKIWICYQGEGDHAISLLDTQTNNVFLPVDFAYVRDRKNRIAVTFIFRELMPDRYYRIQLRINGKNEKGKFGFYTQPETPADSFTFLAGSCALMNTDLSRIFFPGTAIRIYPSMQREKAAFMLWLGDNVYYYGKQHTDPNRMFERNLSVRRKFPLFKRFLTAQPHYAIWDDHDYGWNNANKSFPLKDTALAVFRGFWPNTYPDVAELKGNFFSFRHGHAEFFMTDDRYFRDAPGTDSARMLGDIQMSWLKNRLIASTAPFKFICVGTQVLNTSDFDEDYLDYPKERQELLDFLKAQRIAGVVFLTGDKHYAEISREEKEGYPLYDFTTSPLTSPVLPRKLLNWQPNETQIPGMDFGRRNYGRVTVVKAGDEYRCVLEICSAGGKRVRRHVISSREWSK